MLRPWSPPASPPCSCEWWCLCPPHTLHQGCGHSLISSCLCCGVFWMNRHPQDRHTCSSMLRCPWTCADARMSPLVTTCFPHSSTNSTELCNFNNLLHIRKYLFGRNTSTTTNEKFFTDTLKLPPLNQHSAKPGCPQIFRLFSGSVWLFLLWTSLDSPSPTRFALCFHVLRMVSLPGQIAGTSVNDS